jgi:hypothetical protein
MLSKYMFVPDNIAFYFQCAIAYHTLMQLDAAHLFCVHTSALVVTTWYCADFIAETSSVYFEIFKMTVTF